MTADPFVEVVLDFGIENSEAVASAGIGIINRAAATNRERSPFERHVGVFDSKRIP
jgi:hypothetical protein